MAYLMSTLGVGHVIWTLASSSTSGVRKECAGCTHADPKPYVTSLKSHGKKIIFKTLIHKKDLFKNIQGKK